MVRDSHWEFTVGSGAQSCLPHTPDEPDKPICGHKSHVGGLQVHWISQAGGLTQAWPKLATRPDVCGGVAVRLRPGSAARCLWPRPGEHRYEAT